MFGESSACPWQLGHFRMALKRYALLLLSFACQCCYSRNAIPCPARCSRQTWTRSVRTRLPPNRSAIQSSSSCAKNLALAGDWESWTTLPRPSLFVTLS
ncbi:hypothetical protein C8R47DRAFT_1162714 [Mycena vitilis]|nr:hypothetical protein C8R47DRAFT_1162714 [Mycena vitilis]